MVVKREALSTGLELNSWMGRFVKAMADRFVEIDTKLQMYETGSFPTVRVKESVESD